MQELNPLVKVDVSTDSLDQIGKEQIEKYSIVCVCVFDKVQQVDFFRVDVENVKSLDSDKWVM